jgi:hypothetical protein
MRRTDASRGRGGRIIVLHPPLFAMRLAGRFSPPVRELAGMFALFDAAGYAAGYATDPAPLRDVFGVEALAIEEWAGRVSG